jgi:hypothetical protein
MGYLKNTFPLSVLTYMIKASLYFTLCIVTLTKAFEDHIQVSLDVAINKNHENVIW